MSFVIQKAQRVQAKLRLALCGVAGSGKTMGAIKIAKGLGGRFIVIDTENCSASLYADEADYDVIQLGEPFTPERYIEAIRMCEKEGYSTVIIDSLSHGWAGIGGILDIQDQKTQASSSKNSYMAWREVTPRHNELVNTLLQSKCHIIATMRSKTHYEIMENNGKKQPVKIGLAPIQRDGLDYEFTVVLDIDQKSHRYSSSKDRTELFNDRNEVISEETGKELMNWLNQGISLKDEIERVFSLYKERISNTKTLDDLRKEFEAMKKAPHLNGTKEMEELVKLKDSQKSKIINASDDIPQ